jgi:hypothetical protein
MKNENSRTGILQENESDTLTSFSNNSVTTISAQTYKPGFGIADFWNVQKLRKSRIYRRYL